MTLSSHQRPHRGASDVWLTPPDIIEALGPFDLDPCAAPEPRPWLTAAEHITLPDDGLAAGWGGFVWCNPPFGPEAGRWLDRMAEHRNGIALCPARTETRWFVRGVWSAADAVLFLHGRPHFHHADGTRGAANSGAPICLIAYGSAAVDRLAGSGLVGSLVRLPVFRPGPVDSPPQPWAFGDPPNEYDDSDGVRSEDAVREQTATGDLHRGRQAP